MADATARARAGDNDDFRELTDPYRRELHVHCYRLLGSFQDAEDVLQETLVSAWQALDRFDGRSVRAWLYRIATNRCLNYLRDTSRRPQVATNAESGSPHAQAIPSNEPSWLEPYPDALMDDLALGPEARYEARESIALAFVVGLQRVPARQRAVLVLRDVLGFSAFEVAEILESTPASVNSALQRARAKVAELGRVPEHVPRPRSEDEAKVVDRFVDSLLSGDLDGVIALLSEDAKFVMPPEPFEFRGPRVIAEYLSSRGVWGQALKLVHTRANNQPAFGYYVLDANANVHRARGIMLLTVGAEQISAITRFGEGFLALFGLPRTLPAV